MSNFNFGHINHYLLLGGGDLLLSLALELHQQGIQVTVVTSERRSQDYIGFDADHPSWSLVDALNDANIRNICTQRIADNQSVIDLIDRSTIGISFGAPWIFRAPFIDLFQGRLINCHGSRLPMDRGGGGFSWRIMRGDRVGVALIHQIDPGVDTGNIVIKETYEFPEHCLLPKDYEKVSAEKYMGLLKEFVGSVRAEKDFKLEIQNEANSTYWPRLATDVHGFIDWSWELTDLVNFIRAFDDPYKGATTYYQDQPVRLKHCRAESSAERFHPFQTGLIFRINATGVFVATAQGVLVIELVTNDQGQNITHELRVGERLHTPTAQLEAARSYRAIYTPTGLKK